MKKKKKRTPLDILPNPIKWMQGPEEPMWSARIFLGLRGQAKKGKSGNVYRARAVRDYVKEIRTGQVGDPSATFVIQQGIYRSRRQGIIEEPSVQIIILNTLKKERPKKFEENCKQLTDLLVVEFNQQEAYLEILKDNIRQRTYSFTP